MKKRLILLFSLGLLFSCVGENGGESPATDSSTSEIIIPVIDKKEGEVLVSYYNGNTLFKQIAGLPGSKLRMNKVPEKEGHNFIGWGFKNSMNTIQKLTEFPENDINLYAQFEVEKYFLHFHKDVEYSNFYTYGESIPQSKITDQGLFQGWKVLGDDGSPINIVKDLGDDGDDFYLNPVFADSIFNIEFEPADEGYAAPDPIENATIFSALPTDIEAPEGYCLDGWSLSDYDQYDDEVYIPGETISSMAWTAISDHQSEWNGETITLYPVIRQKEFYVDFYDHDGRDLDQSALDTYDVDIHRCVYTYGDDLPTFDDYLMIDGSVADPKQFYGWTLGDKANPTEAITQVGNWGEDHTTYSLIATLTEKDYKIRFVKNSTFEWASSEMENKYSGKIFTFKPGDALPIGLFTKENANFAGYRCGYSTNTFYNLPDFSKLVDDPDELEDVISISPTFETDVVPLIIDYRIYDDSALDPTFIHMSVNDLRFPQLNCKSTYVYNFEVGAELPTNGGSFGQIEAHGLTLTGWKIARIDNPENYKGGITPTTYIEDERLPITLNDNKIPSIETIKEGTKYQNVPGSVLVLYPTFEFETASSVPMFDLGYVFGNDTRFGTASVRFRNWNGEEHLTKKALNMEIIPEYDTGRNPSYHSNYYVNWLYTNSRDFYIDRIYPTLYNRKDGSTKTVQNDFHIYSTTWSIEGSLHYEGKGHFDGLKPDDFLFDQTPITSATYEESWVVTRWNLDEQFSTGRIPQQ